MTAVFPGVLIRLCQFHVIQAIIRWATSRLRPRRTSSVKALKQSKGKRVVNTRRRSKSSKQISRKATLPKKPIMRKRRVPTPGDTDSESVGDDVPQHGSRLSNGEAINELLDLVCTVQRC